MAGNTQPVVVVAVVAWSMPVGREHANRREGIEEVVGEGRD